MPASGAAGPLPETASTPAWRKAAKACSVASPATTTRCAGRSRRGPGGLFEASSPPTIKSAKFSGETASGAPRGFGPPAPAPIPAPAPPENTWANRSPRLESITASIRAPPRSPSGTPAATASSVGMPTHGRPAENALTRAAARPRRMPVNPPVPLVTGQQVQVRKPCPGLRQDIPHHAHEVFRMAPRHRLGAVPGDGSVPPQDTRTRGRRCIKSQDFHSVFIPPNRRRRSSGGGSAGTCLHRCRIRYCRGSLI